MADITLFELHLDEATFSNTAPVFGGDDEEAASADTDESPGAKGKLFALLALGAIVGLVWLISRSEIGEEIDEEIDLPG